MNNSFFFIFKPIDGANLHLANSIIVGAEYGSDGTGSAAIAIAPANMSGNASFTTFESAGYYIVNEKKVIVR